MTDSVCTVLSVVVGGEVASGGGNVAEFPELPVVPDADCEREDALADARPDPVGSVGAVLFQGELALEGVVDGLDPLTDPAERAEALGLSLAVGTDELRVECRDDLLELLSAE